jgi:hypothetical protein
MEKRKEGAGAPSQEKEQEPRTIYTARAAAESLVSDEFPNPWYVQRGYGTKREFDDGKLVFTDLELVNGPEEARKKAKELAKGDDMILGI